MVFNLHTHTVRCGHATGTEEEYVRAAIDAGIQVLGFADHTPYNYPGGFISTIRMGLHELQDYAQTLRALQKQLSGTIDIRLGLEAEYFPTLFSDLQRRMADVGIEYILLGQHHLGNGVNTHYMGRPSADEWILEQYCDQVIDGLQTGYFTYLAHPDLPNFTGDTKVYARHMGRLCKEAKSCGTPLELNLLGLAGNRHYPNEAFWKLAAEEGCTCILGADAHDPCHFGVSEVEDRAMGLVQSLGLHLLESVPLQKPY